MRRIFALLLAAVLLTGCFGHGGHSNPAPLTGGKPVGTVGNLWQVPHETLERIGPGQLLDASGDLLIYGGGQLALLSAEDLSVRAERSLKAGAAARVQVLADGFCLADPENGTITVLDAGLQTTRVLETDPTDGLLLLSPDARQVYTITTTALIRDGELLRSFRSLAVTAMEKDRVALRVIGTEDLVIRYYVLELESGALTEEPESREKALRLDLQALGDQWLWMGNRVLMLYGPDGACISRCPLPKWKDAYCGRELVWSERWQGWFFLDHIRGDTRLMFWDPGVESPADPVDIQPEVVPEGKLLDSELYDRAEELARRFSVDIRIAERAGRSYKSYTAQLLEDPQVTAQALDILEQALSRYPEGFLAQLPFEEAAEIRIELVDSVSLKSDADNVSDTSAFSHKRSGHYLLVFDARKLREGMVYHELSHIIDKRLAWETHFREDALFSEERWMALQPEGFAYADSYDDVPADVKQYYSSGYFAQDYACISASEDRATMIEKAMLGEEAVFEANPHLLPKLQYYCDCIRDSFDTAGWPEILPWEQLLEQ